MTLTPDSNDHSSWPYSSLILFGYFGNSSPGGKKLAFRTSFALLLFVIAFILLATVELVVFKIAALILVPLSVLMIMWAYKEYLSALDELSRGIQYKAFAISYGAAMALAFTLAALTLHTELELPAAPFYVILAEGIRGIALAVIAKRYA